MWNFEALHITKLDTLQSSKKKLFLYLFSYKNNKLLKRWIIFMYFKPTSCFILDSQIINRLISSRTKWHSPCFKMVKKSGRYLLLYESNKEFKIASYFSITLYMFLVYLFKVCILLVVTEFCLNSAYIFKFFTSNLFLVDIYTASMPIERLYSVSCNRILFKFC